MGMIRHIVALSVIITLSSCATTGVSKKQYNESIRKVKIGMAKDDFVHVFSESLPRGAKKYPNGVGEVLEVNVEGYSFFPTGNPNRNVGTGIESQPIWFYFYNDTLVQYGQPNDWPTNPDQIIEIRRR